MFNVYLKNISSNDDLEELGNEAVNVRDNNEYLVLVRTDEILPDEKPSIIIGDVDIPLHLTNTKDSRFNEYSSLEKSFFDNALFLNYFGECELIISIGEKRKVYLINVNVNGYKATVAKEMMFFLSENAEDILLTCFSKSKTGFSSKQGSVRELVKLRVLNNTIDVINILLPKFLVSPKNELIHKLENITNKPKILDEESIFWLSENLDSLEVSDSSNYKLKIKNKFYKSSIPNKISIKNTDLKENRVLYCFVLNAIQYLKKTRKALEIRKIRTTGDFEYDEYIKFDQVIKGMINPILTTQIEAIDDLMKKILKIKFFLEEYLPVSKVKNEVPIQTQFTLRHSHYKVVFNEIENFYKATDAEKSTTEFLLGLRNLSQLFELCCLYSIVQYLKSIADHKSSFWVDQGYKWSEGGNCRVNVLANEFNFRNEYFEYTLVYEKRFFSLYSDDLNLQNGNLIRVDKERNYYTPDFTIKVLNKSNNESYFIILDAKFSRGWRMEVDNKYPSVLRNIYEKYGVNLRSFRNGGVTNQVKYVGVLFGLSINDNERERINLFNKNHDIDGGAPLFPFSAANFVSFGKEGGSFEEILGKYIRR